MSDAKFKSVRRRFTPEERERFQRAKKDVDAEKPAITARALEVKEQMDEAHRAMQLLKREREARGLSLAEVAQRTGMDKSNLSRLENDPNANPTLDTLSRIAHAIGLRLTIGVAAA